VVVFFCYEPVSHIDNSYHCSHTLNALVGWDVGMKTIELFCGTKSFSNVARELGHQTFTVDNNPIFTPNLLKDLLLVNKNDFPYQPDILWASPPCQCFSVASIGTHWNRDHTPKTSQAENAISLVWKTLQIIKELQPTYWFIENPRGMLRKLPMIQKLHRKTVTYCQYGDTRMKPTDIWTNLIWWQSRPACKNGSPCHIAAPRGSRTGTQGLKDATERGKIPEELFIEIFNETALSTL